MDHSSGRVSPHCHYPPAKATPSMLSLTPFLTQHKAGRVPFRFHSRPRRLADFSAEYCFRRETDTLPQQFPPGLSLSSEGSR